MKAKMDYVFCIKVIDTKFTFAVLNLQIQKVKNQKKSIYCCRINQNQQKEDYTFKENFFIMYKKKTSVEFTVPPIRPGIFLCIPFVVHFFYAFQIQQ